MKDSVPAHLVLWASLALRGYLGGRAIREMQGRQAGLEKKATQALLVLKDHQGNQETLVFQDLLATEEQRVTWW